MKELDSVSFERRLTVANAVERPILCVFADASEEASGACAYVLQKKDDDTHAVKFFAAKPVKCDCYNDLTLKFSEFSYKIKTRFVFVLIANYECVSLDQILIKTWLDIMRFVVVI